MSEDVTKTLPPGKGVYSVPAVQQFQAIISGLGRVYRNPDEAYRDNRQNARAMRRDLQIMEPLKARQLATAELPWHLEPEDKKNPEQLEVAKLLTEDLESIPYFTQYKLCLLEAIWFGRYAIQNRYLYDFSKGRKRLMVQDWLPVHGDSLVWRYDNDNLGIRVGVFGGPGTVPLETQTADLSMIHVLDETEREAFVVHAHERQAGEFFEQEAAGSIHGVGIRSYVYWAWYLKHEALGWLTEFMERIGTGFTIWYFEGGNPQSEAAVREAAEAQSNQNVILFPRFPGTDVTGPGLERIEPNSAGVDNLLKVIDEFFGAQIKRFILGQDLSSESHGTGLGSGVADFHQSTLARIIRYDATNLEETLTRDLVAVMQRYSYSAARYRVRFKFDIDQPDPKHLLEAAHLFWDMGGDIDADDLRGKLGLVKPDTNSQVLRKSEAEGNPFDVMK